MSSAQPLPSASVVGEQHLARGQGVLLVAAPGTQVDVQVQGKGAQAPLQLDMDEHALLVQAGRTALRIRGLGLQPTPLPALLPRLLAYYDHTRSIERPAPSPTAMPCMLRVPQALQQEAACRDWLLGQLLHGEPRFGGCAAQWARSEIYQVVRLVLANPDSLVQQLADRYGYSPAQFRRVCLRAFGRPLKEQQRLLRATRALHLHADTGASFTRVATETGFSSPSHFFCDIKSLLGHSPRAISGPTRRS